jgi:palmitoyltransferase
MLLGWHIYLILQNKTTVEVCDPKFLLILDSTLVYRSFDKIVTNGMQYHEGVRAMWLAEKGGDLYHHPYDLGVYDNLISVRTILTDILLFFESINVLHLQL